MLASLFEVAIWSPAIRFRVNGLKLQPADSLVTTQSLDNSRTRQCEQVVRRVPVGRHLQILASVVSRYDDFRLATPNQGIEGVLTRLGPSSGCFFSQSPVAGLIANVRDAFMWIIITSPLRNTCDLMPSHSSGLLSRSAALRDTPTETVYQRKSADQHIYVALI